MKSTVTIFFLFVLSVVNLFAQQNLVPNGSFEEYSECPEMNDLNGDQFGKLFDWWSPNTATPDFFHRCNNNLNIPSQGVVGVPNNFWGHQDAFHGDAYVGIVPYEWEYETGEIIGGEYIATQLKTKLKPCYKYFFSMRVNFANKSMYSYTRLGAFFSHELLQIDGWDLMNKDAHVMNETLLDDTTAWELISGEFQANGNEKYLYIGYFDEPFVGDTAYFQDPNFPFEWRAGYYYIDSVALYEIGEVEGCNFDFPNVFTPNSDDINDVYSVDFLAGEEDFEFVILNRWGNVITTLNRENLTWDGTSNGKKCTDGVYFYKYTIQKTDGTELKGNGTIHLMR